MTLNLTCEIEGGNPLATLTWNCYKGNVMDESSGNKTIRRVTWIAERNKDGSCTCTAYHPAFSSNRSDTINVEILCEYFKTVLLTRKYLKLKVLNNECYCCNIAPVVWRHLLVNAFPVPGNVIPASSTKYK